MKDKDLDTLRRFYARLVTRAAGVEDRRIVDAFASVKRERFLGAGPWPIKVAADGYMDSETNDPAVLYQDIVIGIVPSRGLNNGEPSLHAKCLGAVAARLGETVVHIGAGTGYYTAILAQLVGRTGHVHAFEIEADLARRTAENLAQESNVTVHAHSALGGPLPSADIIYVSAGVTDVPAVWLDALALGGRLVLPLTPTERLGCMLLVTHQPNMAYGARIFSTAGFIPCVGARDERQSRALAAALDAGTPDDVRSLRRGNAPDETAWCVGDGWWLSRAAPTRAGH
jgi:protein-L-isoaspartate(D-aspartate) O-methyltransferase